MTCKVFLKEVEESKIKSIVDILIRERLIKEVQEMQFKNSKYPSALHNYEFVHPILTEILEEQIKITWLLQQYKQKNRKLPAKPTGLSWKYSTRIFSSSNGQMERRCRSSQFLNLSHVIQM